MNEHPIVPPPPPTTKSTPPPQNPSTSEQLISVKLQEDPMDNIWLDRELEKDSAAESLRTEVPAPPKKTIEAAKPTALQILKK